MLLASTAFPGNCRRTQPETACCTSVTWPRLCRPARDVGWKRFAALAPGSPEADVARFFGKSCSASLGSGLLPQNSRLCRCTENATRARPTMTSLIAVSSYTDTDILAHTPKGAENDQGIT